MSKTLTIFISTTPYSSENSNTAIRLAEAALAKGYTVNLFASGDGVHNFTLGQKARGAPEAATRFAALIEKGLHVELCGTCLTFRGIAPGQLVPGAPPSTMKGLFALMKASDVFVSLGL
jgi:tRNA 2-thiouridine synthesizing protein D